MSANHLSKFPSTIIDLINHPGLTEIIEEEKSLYDDLRSEREENHLPLCSVTCSYSMNIEIEDDLREDITEEFDKGKVAELLEKALDFEKTGMTTSLMPEVYIIIIECYIVLEDLEKAVMYNLALKELSNYLIDLSLGILKIDDFSSYQSESYGYTVRLGLLSTEPKKAMAYFKNNKFKMDAKTRRTTHHLLKLQRYGALAPKVLPSFSFEHVLRSSKKSALLQNVTDFQTMHAETMTRAIMKLYSVDREKAEIAVWHMNEQSASLLMADSPEDNVLLQMFT